MSSSGQAPNVSMDELLSSIKSMIEGESNGGGNPADTGAGGAEGVNEAQGQAPKSLEALDEEIMDLTKVVKNDPVVPVTDPGEETAAALGMVSADAMQQAELPGEMPTGMTEDPAQMAMAAELGDNNPLATGNDELAGAEEAAAQLNDLLGGMSDALQNGQPPVMGGGDAGMAQMDAPGGIDQAGDLGGQPPLPPQDTPQMTETDMPLEQGNAMMAAEGQTPDMADETVAKMQGMHDQGQHLPPDAPMQQTPPPQGQPPVDPQIMAQEQMGQPPIEQAPMGQPPAGQPPMGQGMPPMQGQPPHRGIDASGAPQGQPPMQQQIPPGGVEQGGDPRLASEAAMGQALTQAQASLNTTPAQQQMHQQQPQGQPPVQPGGPVAQNADLPVLSHGNQMVAMPGNTRQMQMMQPQYMPQPTAEQLPLEMRNNLEEIVKQLLKPLLREWLERNLPELLQNSIDPQTGKIDPDKM